MPNDRSTDTLDSTPYSGSTFYAPARDAVAYLLSGIVLAVLVAYVSMLAAWAAAGAGA